ncbi:hypothetical protein E8E13_011246 [Curvularia kusanoi]|uniref:Uncharacterized protein n=1 Tax=Curvularia kusanoi TaxID=90978 RepID=A0A9P4TLR7_CURKU|nr:hypothetical protein E8E13_011246 [Curvularia kusanoi]
MSRYSRYEPVSDEDMYDVRYDEEEISTYGQSSRPSSNGHSDGAPRSSSFTTLYRHSRKLTNHDSGHPTEGAHVGGEPLRVSYHASIARRETLCLRSERQHERENTEGDQMQHELDQEEPRERHSLNYAHPNMSRGPHSGHRRRRNGNTVPNNRAFTEL